MVGLIAFCLVCGLLPGLIASLLLLALRVAVIAFVVVKWVVIGVVCVSAFILFFVFNRGAARQMWREANGAGLSARRATL